MNRRLKVFRVITKTSHTPGILMKRMKKLLPTLMMTNLFQNLSFLYITFVSMQKVSQLLAIVFWNFFKVPCLNRFSFSIQLGLKKCVIPVSRPTCVFSYHFHEGVGLNNNLWNRRQIKQFCFWRRILIDCLEVEENQGSSRLCSREILHETTTDQQVTIKPLTHTAAFYIDIFSLLDIFASATRTRAAEVGCYCFHT